MYMAKYMEGWYLERIDEMLLEGGDGRGATRLIEMGRSRGESY
jgi:hypothetical protein